MCHLGAALVGVGLLCSSATTSGIGTSVPVCGNSSLADVSGRRRRVLSDLVLSSSGRACNRALRGPPVRASLRHVVESCCRVDRVDPGVQADNACARKRQRCLCNLPGWEKVFPSHPVYLAVMMAQSAGYFFVCEYALRRWLAPKEMYRRLSEPAIVLRSCAFDNTAVAREKEAR